MKQPVGEDLSFAVFPYLKTSGMVRIGALEFRSTEDTSGLPASVAEQIRKIAAMLFLKDDFRIESASYAILPHVDLDYVGDSLDSLRRIQSVIAYCYAAPHKTFGNTFLSAEHATCIVCTPGRVSILQVQPQHHVMPAPSTVENVMDTVQGLRCLTNFKHHSWLTFESRIYPPVPEMPLNISQDLCADFGQSLPGSRSYGMLLRIISQPSNSVTERILTAINWFNLSNTMDTDQETAVVNLAIAFEALLQLPEGERKTERLVDSVSLLLGRIPRLDAWVRQFYDARSQIAHEGKADQLRFVVRGAKKNEDEGLVYRSLLSYGRQVFQLCLSSVLFGSELARGAGLEEKLVTNQQRFEILCKILSDNTMPAGEKFKQCDETIYAIDRYLFVFESGPDLNTMLGALRLSATTLLEIEGLGVDDFSHSLEAFASAKRTADQFEALDALARLSSVATSTWQSGVSPSPRHKVLTLIHAVWNYTYRHYFWIKKQRDEAQSSG